MFYTNDTIEDIIKKIKSEERTVNMIHEIDLTRVMGSVQQTERKINAVMTACKNSTTEWSKNYWFNVWKTLCTKYGRLDLYRKDLH